MIIKRTIPVTIIVIFLLSCTARGDDGPQLSLPDSIFDFGYVTAGTTVEHTFWLHSTGTDTLRVIKIRPG